jgi:hypothetical protein
VEWLLDPLVENVILHALPVLRGYVIVALQPELPKQPTELCAIAIAELGVTDSIPHVVHVMRLVRHVFAVAIKLIAQVVLLMVPL